MTFSLYIYWEQSNRVAKTEMRLSNQFSKVLPQFGHFIAYIGRDLDSMHRVLYNLREPVGNALMRKYNHIAGTDTILCRPWATNTP